MARPPNGIIVCSFIIYEFNHTRKVDMKQLTNIRDILWFPLHTNHDTLPNRDWSHPDLQIVTFGQFNYQNGYSTQYEDYPEESTSHEIKNLKPNTDYQMNFSMKNQGTFDASEQFLINFTTKT